MASMFDDDDEAPDSASDSPFVEPVDSEIEVPEAEEVGSTPLPSASVEDSSPYYVSAPEEAPPPEEQGPFGGEGAYSSPAEAPEQAPSDGQPTDDNEWLKPIPVPQAVQFDPYKDTSPQLDALRAQYAKEATENTRPSVGRRILAGLAGGAAAFGSHNPAEGAAIAKQINSAPAVNAAARNARAERPLAQDLANVQTENAAIQRANALKQQQGTEADRQYRNQAYAQDQEGRARNFAAQAEARRNAPIAFTPDDPNNPYAGGTVKTASGQIVKGQPPPDKWIANWEKNPANKAKADAIKGLETLQQMKAAGINVSPENAQIIASGGKVTPAVRTTVSIREGGGTSKSPDDPDALIAKSIADKQKFADQWQRVDAAHASAAFPEGSYIPADADLQDAKLGDKTTIKKSLTPQQFANQIDGFRTNLNASAPMRKAGVQLDENGNVISGRQPSAQPAGPVTTTRTTTNGQTATFNRSEIPAKTPLPAGHVWVKAPGPHGAVGYIPSANLDKAIARGYAVPGS